MDPDTPWRNLGVIGLRIVDLVVRYAITFAITWAAVSESLSPDFRLTAYDFQNLFETIGIPSLLISVIYGLASKRSGLAFRGPLSLLLLLPLWYLVFFPPLLPIAIMGQFFFALCAMRTLRGPSQLRRLTHRALTAAARLAQTQASRNRRLRPGTFFPPS
ncbi:hypothetical protein ACF07V_36215 [Streptomyces sp. NPDC015661]|uniref:hypothetical protein n=1 Tax=Streptomyces sp. NPDC015661 TaxID=3364961 RepID=UPI0036F91FB7